ncbi:MAG TPA: glycosyltransferase family 2 protein, partial [Pseudolysinimonas sp.]|nr:glycosyltransferase family 2 protein [Pseudolysinimonas sp.]
DWWGWVLALVYLPPLMYLGLLLVAAIRQGGNVVDWLRFGLATATMHLSWGLGFLLGVARGARDAVDRSRVES